MRRAALCALTAAALLAGCATAQRPDPLEPLNRKVFAFSEAVDAAVLKPTAEAYRAVLPTPAQIAVSNFFGNLKDAWSAVNLLLQGRVAFFIAMHHFGNFADFRFYRTGNNHTSTTAVYDDRTHITQIFSIC